MASAMASIEGGSVKRTGKVDTASNIFKCCDCIKLTPLTRILYNFLKYLHVTNSIIIFILGIEYFQSIA